MKNLSLLLWLIIIGVVTILPQNKDGNKTMDIKIQSNAFKEGGMIPSKFTCDGANVSPEIKWSSKKEGIKTFVLILHDPDAPNGDYVHWVAYNIPANVHEFMEEITTTKNIPDEVLLGTNSFGRVGYNGPCPPSGTHNYIFDIYGIDIALHNEAGLERDKIMQKIKGHVIAEGKLTGKYKRNK